MAEEIKGTAEAKIVETEEEPFRPGAKKVEVTMVPVKEEEPYTPPAAPYPALPEPRAYIPTLAPPPKKSVVVNIETTGIFPWDSRIICIAAADVKEPEKIEQFVSNDESVMVRDFLAWFESKGFTEVIGYNVSFDHRFIFAKALRYRLLCGSFAFADLLDMMNLMKQVKMEFVFNYNKPGTLDQWAAFLFGMEPAPDYADILEAYKNGDVEFAVKVNEDKVNKAMLLWVLVQYCEELIHA